MKKAILITLVLFIITFAFAEEQFVKGERRVSPQSSRTRTEVAAWQETFDNGLNGWTLSPNTAVNLWHIDVVNDAPSPIYAMINQNEDGSYNPSMNNYLVTPAITLPLAGIIKADFMIKGAFDDPDNGGANSALWDYWTWQISVQTGTTWSGWRDMTHPYTSTGGNVAYTDAPDTWLYVTDSYGVDGLLTDLAGQNVKFRINFHSDSDTPIGTGIMIDNYTIFNDVYLPAPTELMGVINEGQVELNWTAPLSGVSLETITSTNSEWRYIISDADAYAMKIVNPFTTPLQLNGVSFQMVSQGGVPIEGSPDIHVYENVDGLPGPELATVNGVINIPSGEWKFVNVTSQNVIIPASGSVFVGISNLSSGPSTQGLRSDTTSVNLDSYALLEGDWLSLNEAYDGIKNCALAGVYFVDDPFAPAITGYKVYHALNINDTYDLIATIPNATVVTYTDDAPVPGSINYYKVTALFDQYESDPSNLFQIDLISLLYTELVTDDGISNQDFNVGPASYMATKFVTDANAVLRYAKIFINSIGTAQISIKVYNNNGTDGLPGAQAAAQFIVPTAGLVQGWNTVALPTTSIYTDIDGIFYISILELAGSSVFALDTDASGNSWKKVGSGGTWQPITEGNVMIRALVYWPDANEDIVEVTPVSNLTSYPNPFINNTNISFDVQKAGIASLRIYNLKGQVVKTISSGLISKGTNNFSWDGTDSKGKVVSHGIYFCKLEANGTTLTKKIIRVK